MFQTYLEIISKEKYKRFEKQHQEYITSEKYKQRLQELLKRFFTNEDGQIVNTIIIPYISPNEYSITSIDKEIINYLNNHGYKCTEESYLLGYCVNNKNKEISIINVLKMINQYNIEKLEQDKKNNPQYSTHYDNRIKAKQNFKENYLTYYQNFTKDRSKVIVFTWLPRAIASMSTDVGWRSCMNLYDGQYRNYVFPTIEAGAFIAWLVQEGDEEILNNPQARILIKVYVSENGNIFWYPSENIYGTAPKDFHNKVKDFVIKKQEIYITEKDLTDIYTFDKKQYLDRKDHNTLSMRNIFKNKYKKMLEDKFKNKKNFTIEDLKYAIENNIDIDTLTKILSLVKNKLNNTNFEEIFNMAYKYHNIDFIKILLNELLNDEKIDKKPFFIYAALINDINIIKFLLKNKVDPSSNNNRAIQIAAEKGYIEIVKLLLQDERVYNNDVINQLLHIASQYGHTEIIKLILQDSQIDLTMFTDYIMKAMDNAVSNGHTEIVKLLLQIPKINLNTNYQLLNSFLIKASSRGFANIVKILLQNPNVDPNTYNYEAMKNAISYGHTEVVKALLQDKRTDISTYAISAIYSAAANGYADILQLLLQDPRIQPIKQNINYDSILQNTIEKGHTEAVKVLLQDMPALKHINMYLKESIKKALLNRNFELMKILLQHPKINAHIHDIDDMILYHSVNNNYIDLLRTLLQDSRVDPSYNKNYAIQKAAENGYTEIVQLLLQDKRVNPGVKHNYALRIAIKKGYIEIAKLLLHDPRVNPADNKNYAIRIAAQKGYTEIVKLLLQDKRVDPGYDHNYAFLTAVKKNHIDVIKLLLQDPRVDIGDLNNYAIRIAVENNSVEIVKLLLQDERTDPTVPYNNPLKTAIKNRNITILNLLLQDKRVLSTIHRDAQDILQLVKTINNEQIIQLIQQYI